MFPLQVPANGNNGFEMPARKDFLLLLAIIILLAKAPHLMEEEEPERVGTVKPPRENSITKLFGR